jgi:PPOX class F420-dependent enzyme/OxyR family protein
VHPFTDEELQYLRSQRLARIATASAAGQPDVSPVGFGLDGDALVSGGLDITKTIRYRNLQENPRATMVIDDLASWIPGRLAASRCGDQPPSSPTRTVCGFALSPRSSGAGGSTKVARSAPSFASNAASDVPS